MVFLVLTIVAVAAFLAGMWSVEPILHMTWRRGEGWTVWTEGFGGLRCAANTTV
ncbi:MAG: hypothetical protein ACT6TH_15335 [Brevundimonas sp.]|uniref:hypothetical protein n=1 Tax=Brevundimonas sp. TaxID=1871086 RepID=UPI00403363C0